MVERARHGSIVMENRNIAAGVKLFMVKTESSIDNEIFRPTSRAAFHIPQGKSRPGLPLISRGILAFFQDAIMRLLKPQLSL